MGIGKILAKLDAEKVMKKLPANLKQNVLIEQQKMHLRMIDYFTDWRDETKRVLKERKFNTEQKKKWRKYYRDFFSGVVFRPTGKKEFAEFVKRIENNKLESDDWLSFEKVILPYVEDCIKQHRTALAEEELK